MRYFVCVVFLALWIVACKCTAESEGTEQDGQGSVSAPTASAATPNGSPSETDALEAVETPAKESKESEDEAEENKDESKKSKAADEIQNAQAEYGRSSTPDVQDPLQSQNTKDKSSTPNQKTGGSENEKKADVEKTITTTAQAPGVEKGVSSPTEGNTTTTTAPANTSLIHSKIQQSVNNKDSSSSISLLLAFAMLATLAVIPVLPV